VALIAAPEAGESIGRLGRTGDGARERLFGRQRIEVGAGSGARFVGAVGAIAGVVVDLIQAQLDCSVRDAGEFIFVLIMDGDLCCVRFSRDVEGSWNSSKAETYNQGRHREEDCQQPPE
jgi:hypothetical protein